MTPRLSIIIPAYNVERFIVETLESVRGQTFREWECIVVDDGSKDGTAATVERWIACDDRFRLVRQANAGVAAARNAGFAQASATARYVMFMDADDVYLPHAFATLHTTLEQKADIIGAHGLAEMIDHLSVPVEVGGFSQFQRERTGFDGRGIVRWPLEKPTTFETVLQHSRVYPPGLVMVRRAIVEKVGPFDKAVSPVEDWDMLIRYTRHGALAFLDDVILYYRRHPGQATANERRIHEATARMHKKTEISPENSAEHRALIRGARRSWHRMKAAEKAASAVDALRHGRVIAAAKFAGHVAGYSLLRFAR
jgi:glycosyltransferase involved in cell wall biosynthesis